MKTVNCLIGVFLTLFCTISFAPLRAQNVGQAEESPRRQYELKLIIVIDAPQAESLKVITLKGDNTFSGMG